jgi:DNA-binding winged helix-turn-helix (wHTH) protein
MQVLLMMAEQPGEVLTKEQLIHRFGPRLSSRTTF